MSFYSPLIVRRLKKSGKWQGILKYKDPETGIWRQTTRVAKELLKTPARRELEAWEEQMNATAKDTDVATNKGLTVREVVLAYLNEQLALNQIERSTYDSQIMYCETVIFPALGNYIFADLDENAIKIWLKDLAAKGYKQTSISSYYTVIRKVYIHYKKHKKIAYNPFDYITPPKRKKTKGVRHSFCDPEQLDLVYEFLNEDFPQGHWFWTGVNMDVLSGMRRGELCGLRWHNVNFRAGNIDIDTAIGKKKHGTYTKMPKNESSIRSFPIIPQLMEVLQARYNYVLEQEGEVQGNWYVIGERDKYRKPDTFYQKFYRWVREHELVDHYGNYLTLHALRHNFATLGVKSNMDIASLSRMLGHGNKTVTLEMYADTSPMAMELAAKKLAKGFNEETDFLGFFEGDTVSEAVANVQKEDSDD